MKKAPLLIATTNQGKYIEFTSLLHEAGIKTLSLSDCNLKNLTVKETGSTFTQNALIKAKMYAQASNSTCLADDSGLCVTALGGLPGVESRRYGTSDNQRIQRLLRELKGITGEDRRAYFETSLAIYNPQSKKSFTATGRVDGYITTKPYGTSGFGYDPVFFSPELNKTFGQASRSEKATVSHRSRALKNLLSLLDFKAIG
jgi:XTP/dITP diphosphohydrolase